jgi:hypothetical protein
MFNTIPFDKYQIIILSGSENCNDFTAVKIAAQ